MKKFIIIAICIIIIIAICIISSMSLYGKLNSEREKVADMKMEISRVRGMDVVEDILKKTIDSIHWRTIKKINSLIF